MAELIIGSYEDYVLGYKFLDGKQPQLEQTFAVRGHSGSVRCVATNQDGSLALSSGYDEVLNLFGLRKRKLLQTSEGAINCATFAENSYLICGSEDSNIYIYLCKASSMTLVKTLKGHKDAVTSLSVHPSGKVLLSISKDNTMRTWNLIKGRCAYVTNIQMQAHLVSWSKTGNEFVIAANNEIYLYNNDSGNLINLIKLDKRINAVEFITNSGVFVVAKDSGKLDWFDLKSGSLLMSSEAHETRIKGVKHLGFRATPGSARDSGGSVEDGNEDSEEDCKERGPCLIATMSSDGVLKVWLVAKPGATKPQELASESTGARLTCLTSATLR